MKFLLLTVALISTHAFASVPVIKAYNTTCAELNESLSTYKEIVVVKKFLGIKTKKRVYVSANCDGNKVATTAYFKTLDNRDCAVGQFCKIHIEVDVSTSYSGGYSSGSSYDSGYSSGSSSSSDSYSGPSYNPPSSSDHGPSYNPPSSSDHGPSYNPPSSSDHGPSYNPPSSGTRGSHYCPSCSL